MARMKFICDAERCIECNGCVTACKNLPGFRIDAGQGDPCAQLKQQQRADHPRDASCQV